MTARRNETRQGSSRSGKRRAKAPETACLPSVRAMTPKVTMREALADPNLLGTALPGPSWEAWRVMLIALMGEPLVTEAEREIFRRFTRRHEPPSAMAREAWFVIGRRGGKSRAIAVLTVYLACLCKHRLVKGETGVALVIAPDKKQARVILDYAGGIIEDSPLLRQTVVKRLEEELQLKGRIKIEVRSSSFRRIRGLTAIAVLADECAFWLSEDSSNPDTEILNAARPALATTGGLLVCISSPHARTGALWETFRRDFGPDGDPAILVVHGASRDFNPELSQEIVDKALERDFAAASAEYLAEFRTDVEGFVPREAVEACVDLGVFERPFDRGKEYVAFVDPSGGASDAFTLAIAHTEGKTQVLDVVRERRPPFSPEAVVDEYCALLKSYRISTVTGDRYAGEWVAEQFRKRGIYYQQSERSKSDIYVDLLPLLNSRAVALLENDRLTLQLTMLERRTSRGGKDSIDHPKGGHDDLANSVAGALVTAFKEGAGIPPSDDGERFRPLWQTGVKDAWLLM
jgi:hypothetical protein